VAEILHANCKAWLCISVNVLQLNYYAHTLGSLSNWKLNGGVGDTSIKTFYAGFSLS
jgi:hypothetical protein